MGFCPSVHHGNESMLEYFMKFNPDWVSTELPITNWTPLMFAANSEKLLSYLLDHGADPNVTNVNGKSALDLAVKDKAKIILQNAKNYSDQEAEDKCKYLHSKFLEACQNSDIDSFYKILKEDIDLDYQAESNGTTGLMVSAHAGAKIHVLSKNSHIENLTFDKIHLSEISFFWQN